MSAFPELSNYCDQVLMLFFARFPASCPFLLDTWFRSTLISLCTQRWISHAPYRTHAPWDTWVENLGSSLVYKLRDRPSVYTLSTSSLR